MTDFDLNLIWQLYREALRFGSSESEKIRTALNLGPKAYTELLTHPAANAAVQAADSDRLPAIFESLSDEAKSYWQLLNAKETTADSRQAALLAIAANGERERQKLLAWGLTQNYFDINGACRALNIPLKQFRSWVANDPEFAEMIGEIQASKRYFVEGQLMRLIGQGSEKATVFAAERLMRDQYGNKIEHTGTIEHQHEHNQTLSLENLPLELKAKVLELISSSGLVDPDGLLAETVEASEVKRLT